MINWISVKDDTPKECCNGISEKVLVAGIDDWGDRNWGESNYYIRQNKALFGFTLPKGKQVSGNITLCTASRK